MKTQIPAYLILKTGDSFSGFIETSRASYPDPFTQGEVVFNTGMTGYVEALTDPSYAGQILCFTYPLIGNYGVCAAEAWESEKIQVRAVIMSELMRLNTHPGSLCSLADWLQQENIPCLYGVDTRALTQCLRVQGTLEGLISSLKTEYLPQKITDCFEQVGINTIRYYGQGTKTIIVVDCGIKESILRCLLHFPIQIKRVPYDYDYTNETFEGVVLSNGPGDPQIYSQTIAILRKALTIKKPIFGICLGAQLMALAVGAHTYKMRFGHRSQNQPCLESATGRCYLTAQNHGYAIDDQSLPENWQVSFRNLNDNTVAGIAHRDLPFYAVQFHPEAAAGPLDTRWLFEKFYWML